MDVRSIQIYTFRRQVYRSHASDVDMSQRKIWKSRVREGIFIYYSFIYFNLCHFVHNYNCIHSEAILNSSTTYLKVACRWPECSVWSSVVKKFKSPDIFNYFNEKSQFLLNKIMRFYIYNKINQNLRRTPLWL